MFPWLNNSVEQMQRDFPLIKFSEILSLFSQFKFLRKEEVLPNLDWSRDVTGKINIIQCLLFSKSASWKNRPIQGFQKLFYGDISLYLLNIVATTNLKKKIQKLYFDNFICCKLPDMAGCSSGLRNVQSVQMHRGPPLLGPPHLTYRAQKNLIMKIYSKL